MTKDGMVRLGSLIDEVKIRNKEQDCPVYSVTNSKGFVPSGEYFSKTVYSEELSGYKVVPYGAFAYNPSRINVGSIGYQDVAEKVAVSPLYNVFTISDAVSPRYLIGYFKSDIGLCSVRAKAHGSVRDTLRISDLGQINMPCPSMREQMHVGEVLEVLDEHREKLQRRQELFNQLAKSRFVEMFGATPQTVVPAGRVLVGMRNGVSPSSGGQLREKVLTLSAITQGQFDDDAWKDGTFSDVPPSDKRVSSSDFYICRGNGNIHLVGAGEYSATSRDDLVFPDTMIAARVDEAKVILPFLRSAWAQPFVREQIERRARTTNGTFKINQQIVASINIPLPPLSLQREFAEFTDRVDKSQFEVRQQINRLEMLRSSLMQKYFG